MMAFDAYASIKKACGVGTDAQGWVNFRYTQNIIPSLFAFAFPPKKAFFAALEENGCDAVVLPGLDVTGLGGGLLGCDNLCPSSFFCLVRLLSRMHANSIASQRVHGLNIHTIDTISF